MSSFRFSALKDQQVLAFDPAVDVLQFDRAVWHAGQMVVAAAAAGVRLTLQGKTVQLEGVRLAELSSAHVTFVDGSQLLVGDDSSGLGDGAANTLTGGAGSDYLDGLGGADVLRGGGGNDVLVARDLAFRSLSGGAGTDTVRLAGQGLTWDLTALGSKVTGIEVLELSTDWQVVLDASAVIALSSTTDRLLIEGGQGSVVHAGFGWTPGLAVERGGELYLTYAQGRAELWINETVGTISISPSPQLPLAALDGTNGFRLDGAVAGDYSGCSVSGAGDVNGDGFDDLIIGAPYADPNDVYSGSSYLVFGKAGGLDKVVSLSALDGTNGFRLDGIAGGEVTGRSVSAAGDFNGDGFHDLIIGTNSRPAIPEGRGSSYVVFGRARGLDAALPLSALDGTNGFRLDGKRSHYLSVNNAGDVNGDGFDDLIVGGLEVSQDRTLIRASYVVFGKAGALDPIVPLSALNGTNGFRLDGLGLSVSAAGDVNGDGFDDLIVGGVYVYQNLTSTLASYVVFGKAAGFPATQPLSALDGSNGFRLDGAGKSVSGAGDVNGDGFGDLIIGGNSSESSGSSYVVFGKASGFALVVPLSSLDGTNGFRLDGLQIGEFSGPSVSEAGDVNGDGFDDLIVGALNADFNGESSGSSYVVFGAADGFAAALSLSALDGTNGFRLDGASAHDRSGYSASAAGDVNGDGFDDLIIGSIHADPHGESSGSSYVVYGGNLTGAVTKLGTAGADRLTGTAAWERFVGGQGDDVMDGRGGADGFEGGAGNDRIEVADLNFHSVDGGSGEDTLALAGKDQTLDLAAWRGHLDGLERLDLTGSGGNRLSLNGLDVLRLSDSTSRLIVDGDTGDRVTFQDGGWVSAAPVVVDGVTYHAYSQNRAEVLIGSDLLSLHRFSQLVDHQVLAFVPEFDVLRFDGADWDAGALTIVPSVSSVELRLNGKAVLLEGVTVSQLSSVHVTFANGSVLRLGDDTIAFRDGLGSTLSGGDGNDYLDGLGGADVLQGGRGDDTYIVDRVADRVQEELGAGFDTIRSAVSYVLPVNVEALWLTETGALHGTGNELDNVLYSGVGDNVLDGGVGNDTASYQYGVTAGVRVSLTAAAQATRGSGTDRLQGIENLTGSHFGDVLTGDGGGNVLQGGSGNDRLGGGAGHDRLEGGWGNDSLVGGAGDDTLDGGDGKDTGDYRTAIGGVTVDLRIVGPQDTRGAGTDMLTSIENLTGSIYGDVLLGNAGDNLLQGGSGDDQLDGGAGHDRLAGGWADDALSGGAGDDTLDGSDGNDTGDYRSAPGGVAVDLRIVGPQDTRGAGTDTLTGIENLLGSLYGDSLIGDAADNGLMGDDGDDILLGAGGNDTLQGGQGNDVLRGGAGSDTADYRDSDLAVTVDLSVASPQDTAGAGTDTLASVENLIGSAASDRLIGSAVTNVLWGGDGDDHLEGGDGDDTLVGGEGNDTLDGGAGADTADYSGAQYGVVVDLNVAGPQDTRGAGTDTLTGIENLIGSSYDNIFVGDAGNNVLRGGAGDDSLVGEAGNDILWGGEGLDTFYFEAAAALGVDTIKDFTSGGDALYLGDVGDGSGSLSDGAFYQAPGATAAHDDTDLIIFDTATGMLYFDEDGAGGVAAVPFAQLVGVSSLTVGDFYVPAH